METPCVCAYWRSYCGCRSGTDGRTSYRVRSARTAYAKVLKHARVGECHHPCLSRDKAEFAAPCVPCNSHMTDLLITVYVLVAL